MTLHENINMNKKTIFFLPEKPIGHKINPILHYLDIGVSNTSRDADYLMYWNHRAEGQPVPDKVKEGINANCLDTRKSFVEARFREVFGYGSFINPLTYKGKYVIKSETNGVKDGTVVTGKHKYEAGKVYQKFFDTDKVDYRIPVIGGTIPLQINFTL